MLDSRSIQGIIVLIFGIIIAVWLGSSIVTAQSETLLYTVSALLLCTCIFLGRKIWLLMILFSALNIPLIRGFSTLELGQFLFLCFSTMIFAMRRLPLKLSFGELECWMLLIAACIVQVYLRNPVGLNLFGASSVGARPYFVVTLTFVSACLLSSIKVPPSEIKWAMWLTLIGSFVGLPVVVWLQHVMPTAPNPGDVSMQRTADTGAAGRVGSLGRAGEIASRWLVSRMSPVRVVLNPLWALVMLFSLAAAAGSGFRSSVAIVGLIYVAGIIYRSGFFTAILAAIAGALLLGALAIINVVTPLPPNIQRALSPFPGTWEERYVEDAASSTEWRVEMWKEALFTERWISNKILGDGLGFTRIELERMQAISAGGGEGGRGVSGLTVQQEGMMLTGGYHSGPVQTVRTVGYVGLIILLLAMIRLAVHAHRQIRRCRGTEWEPIAYFFGIPLIIIPFLFTLIFGDFSRDVSAVMLGFGIIRLLEKNLPLPAYTKLKRQHQPLGLRGMQRQPAGPAEAV